MDAIRIARAYTKRDTVMKIFGSYHGHHDTVMVSHRRRLRRDRRRTTTRLAALRRRHPAVDGRRGLRRPLQRRRLDGAPHRRARPRGPQARLRDHGGGDDEPRGRAPRARLPRGRARHHAPPRRRADLRRGQDRPVHRPGRRDGALRRHARPGHAGQGARRRPAVGAIGGSDEVMSVVEDGSVYQVGTYNGNPLWMAATRANLLEVLTPDAYARLDALNARHPAPAAREVIDQLRPARLRRRRGLEGLRDLLAEKITDYETFKANQDAELADLAWLFNMNRGIFMTPGPRGGVDALGDAHRRGRRPLRRRLRGDGAGPHGLSAACAAAATPFQRAGPRARRSATASRLRLHRRGGTTGAASVRRAESERTPPDGRLRGAAIDAQLCRHAPAPRRAARPSATADWVPSPAPMQFAPRSRARSRTSYPPRSAARRTLPLAVFGSSAAKSTMRGYL